MVSLDEFKDVCVPNTATNSDGEQICMYVCCPSVISSYYQGPHSQMLKQCQAAWVKQILGKLYSQNFWARSSCLSQSRKSSKVSSLLWQEIWIIVEYFPLFSWWVSEWRALQQIFSGRRGGVQQMIENGHILIRFKVLWKWRVKICKKKKVRLDQKSY